VTSVLQSLVALFVMIGSTSMSTQSTSRSVLAGAIEAFTTAYLAIACVVGMQQWRALGRNFRLTPHGTSTAVLIVHAATLMFLASAMPIVAHVLGLTSFNLLGVYEQALYAHSPAFVFVYNSLFLFALTRSIPNHLWHRLPIPSFKTMLSWFFRRRKTTQQQSNKI